MRGWIVGGVAAVAAAVYIYRLQCTWHNGTATEGPALCVDQVCRAYFLGRGLEWRLAGTLRFWIAGTAIFAPVGVVFGVLGVPPCVNCEIEQLRSDYLSFSVVLE